MMWEGRVEVLEQSSESIAFGRPDTRDCGAVKASAGSGKPW